MAYSNLVPNNVEQAQKGLQVSVIKKFNPALAELAVIKLLKDTCQMFGVEWSGEIEVKTTDMILAKYWHLRIEEIAMVLSNASLGLYGKVYGSLKPLDVMEWLGQYDESERTEYHVSKNVTHTEANDKFFREQEKKEAQKANDLLKQNMKYLQAQKDAKKIIDNQNK